jgi:hypothetical protein
VLAPPLDLIRAQVIERFRVAVARDDTADTFSELLAVEEQVAALIHLLGRQLMQAFVDERLRQTQSNKLGCPGCNQPMEWLLHTRWKRGTALGPIEVTDVYAYCRRCHHSARPLHRWLGTDRERWSLWAEQSALDLACDESCQHAVDKLERHHPGLSMERTSVLRMMHKHGAQVRRAHRSQTRSGSRAA